MITINTGGWRPVQGAMHAYAVYTGARGLLFGPAPGQAIADILGPEPSFIIYLFFGSLFLGGLIAMVGEILQLNQQKLDRFIDGLSIEAGGAFLIAMNFAATAFAVFVSESVPTARGVTFVFIALGFFGRCGQAIWDIMRIRKNLRSVVK